MTNATLDYLYSLYKQAKKDGDPIIAHGLNLETGEKVAESRIGGAIASLVNTAITDPISAFNTAAGILGFIGSQFDVLTALSIVSALESRAAYDPAFRQSFPKIARRNAWLL